MLFQLFQGAPNHRLRLDSLGKIHLSCDYVGNLLNGMLSIAVAPYCGGQLIQATGRILSLIINQDLFVDFLLHYSIGAGERIRTVSRRMRHLG